MKKWLTLAIVSSALFLIVVDMTVLYTALPALTRDLQATSSQKLWIINVYALVVSGLLPGLGTLGDRLSHKPVFLAGLAVFGIASLCAAFSPAPEWLIFARVLLAIGAALMMPATLSIIRLTFTDHRERSFAIGVWAAIASGGAAFGPVLGGFLMEHYWWGSVFLINVPIVLLTLVLATVILPKRAGNRDKPWDLKGSLQVMMGLLGGVYAIKELGKSQPSYALAAFAFAVGAFFMLKFVRRQKRQARPLIDFALFRELPFSSAVAAAMVASAALIGMELALSQHMQLVRELSPLEAGLLLLPLPLASVFAGPLTGFMLPRADKAKVLWGSLLLSGIGMASYLLLHDAAVSAQVASLVILGLGLGAVMTAASSAVMLNVAPQQAGMAASIEEVSYELGAVIGVTVLGTILSAVYSATLVIPESAGLLPNAHDTLDAALLAAEQLPAELGLQVSELARSAFDKAFIVVLATASAILMAAAATIRHLHLRARRVARLARAGRLLRDDDLPVHLLVAAAAKIVAQEGVFAGLAGRQPHFGDLARLQVGADVHVRDEKAMDEIDGRERQHDGFILFYGDFIRRVDEFPRLDGDDSFLRNNIFEVLGLDGGHRQQRTEAARAADAELSSCAVHGSAPGHGKFRELVIIPRLRFHLAKAEALVRHGRVPRQGRALFLRTGRRQGENQRLGGMVRDSPRHVVMFLVNMAVEHRHIAVRH